MSADLTQTILHRAYERDSLGLDTIARQLGAADFPTLTSELEFGGWDSGGGCMMLLAELPAGHRLQLTDGEVDVPTNADQWCVGIVDADDDELISVFSAQPVPKS
jgi:hypothetical protein